jgi:hypothetical protein
VQPVIALLICRAGFKRHLNVHDFAIIAELNLCCGLSMLGRWSHGHAAIKRCALIKRSDGVSLQHLKRIVSKYMLILQRTTTILKLSPLTELSVQGSSVWPLLIRCSSSTSSSPSPHAILKHANSMEDLHLSSPAFSSIHATKPLGISIGSPHLAGKLRPGSAGLLRPLSAMSDLSRASKHTVRAHAVLISHSKCPHIIVFNRSLAHSVQAASSGSSAPESAASARGYSLRMISSDASSRLR